MVRGARLPITGSSDGWFRVVNTCTGYLGFYTLEEGPALPSSYASFVNNAEYISEVGLFMFRIDPNNPTQIERFGAFTDADVRTLVAIAHRNNIKIVPVIHNLLYRPGGQTTSREVVRLSAFAANLVNLIEQYNFDGIMIDIEYVYTKTGHSYPNSIPTSETH